MTITTEPCPPSFDAVLCDLDGVIRFFDTSEVTRLERAAGLPAGTTAAAAFAPENGLPLVHGKLTKAQWVESTARTLTADALTAQLPMAAALAMGAALAGAPFRADEAAVQLLRRMRAHCPVLIVTNATPWLDDDLTLLGLTDLADAVVNSARIGIAKPERGIYEIAAEQAGAAPDRCLFIDDRQENVDAAVALGMTGLLYRELSDLRNALAPMLDGDRPAPARHTSACLDGLEPRLDAI